MSKILVVTSTADLHADHCIKRMGEREVDCFRLDTDEYPQNPKISWTISNSAPKVFITNERSEGVSSSDIQSIWYRKPTFEKITGIQSTDHRDFVARETEAMLQGVYTVLGDRLWVNHPQKNRVAGYKLHQLEVADRLGFCTPDTLTTSDPNLVRAFIESSAPEEVIYKTLAMPYIYETDDHFYSVFTSSFELTEESARAIEVAPCLFQTRVAKDHELRIVVLEDRVFAARIFSQDQKETSLDWRRSQDQVDLRQEIAILDPQLEKRCVQLTKELGLKYGAIDVIVTPEGDPVFLEINPNGQWLWMEMLLGLPIADALIDVLTR